LKLLLLALLLEFSQLHLQIRQHQLRAQQQQLEQLELSKLLGQLNKLVPALALPQRLQKLPLRAVAAVNKL